MNNEYSSKKLLSHGDIEVITWSYLILNLSVTLD